MKTSLFKQITSPYTSSCLLINHCNGSPCALTSECSIYLEVEYTYEDIEGKYYVQQIMDGSTVKRIPVLHILSANHTWKMGHQEILNSRTQRSKGESANCFACTISIMLQTIRSKYKFQQRYWQVHRVPRLVLRHCTLSVNGQHLLTMTMNKAAAISIMEMMCSVLS